MTETIDSELLSEVLDDISAGAQVPTGDKLKAVEYWVRRQLSLEDLKESLEEQLKQCNKDLEEVMDRRLPDAMFEAGCSKFETPDKLSVKVEPTYFANIYKQTEAEFYDWLDEEGFGGLINSQVVIPIGKGGHGQAKVLLEELTKVLQLPVEPKLSEDIHWATLRAWAREQTEAGAVLPPTIKVHSVNRAKIKRPKP